MASILSASLFYIRIFLQETRSTKNCLKVLSMVHMTLYMKARGNALFKQSRKLDLSISVYSLMCMVFLAVKMVIATAAKVMETPGSGTDRMPHLTER